MTARSFVVGGTLVATLLIPAVAAAVTSAKAARSAAASSASWSATLVDGGTVLTGRSVTVFGSVLGPVAKNFTARNTGTLPLAGQIYTISASGISLSSVTLTACTAGPWQDGSCAGTAVQVTSGASTALAVPVGGEVGLRLVLPAGLLVSASVSVSTTRAQVRAATTTHS